MNKGLLKIALLSMVCASMPMAITSCKDYDDDINSLTQKDQDLAAQIAAINTAVQELQNKATEALNNANQALAAAASAQDAADKAMQEAKAAREFATSAAAQAKADALAEIANQLKNYTTKDEYNALQSRVAALEAKLANLGGGSSEDPIDYTGALQALQTQLDALNKYKDLLASLEGQEETLKTLTQTINNINAEIAGLKNQTAGFETLLAQIQTQVTNINNALVTINGGTLRGLVFNPVFYYHGIEAMWAPVWSYTQLVLDLTVNADKATPNDAPVYKDSVNVTPDLVATYHMNPSTAAMPKEASAYTFKNTIKDVAYERATPVPTIYSASVANGDVTVKANLKDGIVSYLSRDNKVTVLALEVNLGDTTITSDYAALKPVYTYGFKLADARMAVNPHQTHLYTTMQEAIENDPFANVAWNSEGVNIAEWVDTHYWTEAQKAAGTDTRWDVNATKNTVREQGFTYEYTLVGYTLGENKTSESAHAALEVNGYNCTFRPQMTKDGKQQPFGSEQGMASIDRLPIVRVALKDTISNKYAAVGYMKIQIVPDTKEDEYTVIDPFTFNTPYTAQCKLQAFNDSLTWWQVEEQIIEVLGISKQEFEEQYKPDYTDPKALLDCIDYNLNNRPFSATEDYADTYVLKQFKNPGKDATELSQSSWIGKIGKTEYDDQAAETNILRWLITGDQLYNLFVDQKKTEVSVTVRFVKTYNVSMGSNHVQEVHHYVYVTLTWKPNPLNVTPTGTLENNRKIPEMWYTAWTNQHGGFDETHLNVAVPNNNDTNSANCTFVSHLLYPFVNELRLTFTQIDPVYKGYEDVNLIKSFSWASDLDQTTAIGVSGNQYALSAEGLNLVAKLGTTKENIATIVDPTTSYTTWGADDPRVIYGEGAFAKDILNAFNHDQLLKNETLAGKIQITAVNNPCEKPITVLNNKFNVRFLRPVNMNIVKDAEMTDALNSGSSVDLADFLNFTDWRSEDPISFFSTHNWYYRYYGVESISIGYISKANPANLVGFNPDEPAVTSGSLRGVITTDLAGGSQGVTTLASVTPNMDLIFTPESTIANYSMGTLTYYNNGENINKAFHLWVPIVVKYKWGYLTGTLKITVNPTVGQGN